MYTYPMFQFISKFLPQFFYPLGLVTVLLIFSLVFHRSPKTLKWTLGFAITILWLAGSDFISTALAKNLEWRYLPEQDLPKADVIVLLGGGTLSLQYPRVIAEVSGAGDRVLYAAWLYKQDKAPVILITGANLPWSNTLTSPTEDMLFILNMMGVPEDAVWIEAESLNTYENALYSAELLNQEGIERIILVTSALHMPRSVMAFEKQGVEIIPAPTDFSITQGQEQNIGDNILRFLTGFLPTPQNLDLTTRALKEYIGIFIYRLQGWV